MPTLAFVRRNWSSTGGAENYLLRLAAKLEPDQWETTLLCESWKGEADPFTRILPLPTGGPGWNRPARFADAVNRHLSETPYDCVFSMERGIRAHLYRAGDGVHREWLSRRSRERPLRSWFRNQLNPKNHCLLNLERVTFHPSNTGRVIANSEMVRDDILRHFDFPEDRIDLIPNAVDAETFGSGNRERGREAMGWKDELVCLLVGAGTERKGHRYAIEATRRLGNKVKLVIVDQPPPCTMPDLYAAADIFLLPTLYDPFANVTLEAMAAGLPVVTTRDNGACMVIESGKNGFIIAHASQTAELCAYLLALTDETLRRSIGSAARKSVRLYTPQDHLQATCNSIRKTAKEDC
jgi:UDP-glucose:(heptosyl)LPS alpha-1,3-glucosyltransferase